MIAHASTPDPEQVFANAVPHESGHVLVAYRLQIPVKNICIQVRSEFDGGIVSFIQFPREDEMPHLSDEERLAYCQLLAGGIAGERFATSKIDPLNSDPMDPDSVLLKRFTDRPLTEFEPAAGAIIARNGRAFRQLCSRLRQRYPAIKEQVRTARIGEFTLITEHDLDELLSDLK